MLFHCCTCKSSRALVYEKHEAESCVCPPYRNTTHCNCLSSPDLQMLILQSIRTILAEAVAQVCLLILLVCVCVLLSCSHICLQMRAFFAAFSLPCILLTNPCSISHNCTSQVHVTGLSLRLGTNIGGSASGVSNPLAPNASAMLRDPMSAQSRDQGVCMSQCFCLFVCVHSKWVLKPCTLMHTRSLMHEKTHTHISLSSTMQVHLQVHSPVPLLLLPLLPLPKH